MLTKIQSILRNCQNFLKKRSTDKRRRSVRDSVTANSPEMLEQRQMLTTDFFVVPGSPNQQVELRLDLLEQVAKSRNEIGVYQVDDLSGKVNGLAPGAPGYALAALRSQSQDVLFPSRGPAGASRTMTVSGGTILAFYMVQKGESEALLNKVRGETLPKRPAVFFSAETVSVDGVDHVQSRILSNGRTEFAWEDQKRPKKRDFRDAVYTITVQTNDPPTVTAALASDTGVSTSDRITRDSTVQGTVHDDVDVVGLFGRIDGIGNFVSLSDLLQANDTFNISQSRMAQLAGGSLSQSVHTLELRSRDQRGIDSEVISLTFTYDTTAPALALSLDPASDTAPLGDSTTTNSTVTLIATSEPNATIQLLSPALVRTTDTNGVATFANLAVNLGSNLFQAAAVDPAGNSSASSQVTVTRAQEEISSQSLAEDANFVTEQFVSVTLGQFQGTRTLRFNVTAAFDRTDSTTSNGDQLLVYLVDAVNPNLTLLDRGVTGTALFAYRENGVELAPGLVRFDGTTVEIDVTSISNVTAGRLLFQLLNGDGDEGTEFQIGPVTNVLDIGGASQPTFAAQSSLINAGGPLNFGQLQPSDDVRVLVENVRFNTTTGRYVAEMRVRNEGSALGRQVAVLFPNLPAGVSLHNASGVDSNGTPYLNLQPAIRAGGLQAAARSNPVLIEFDNPSDARFSIRPTVLVGSPNQAPVWTPIAPLTVFPGGRLSVPLSAIDPDGDVVSYMIAADGPLPNIFLQSNGLLEVQPDPTQLGTYSFELVASDGALTSRQTVTMNVVPDPDSTTRISGIVKNTLDQPLAGVPVEIAGFSAVTGQDGRFTIALPTMKIPTEAFNIPIPQGDVFLDPFSTGTQEIRFRRARFDATTGDSVLNPRQHPNLVTSFIDASMVYGSDAERAAALRSFTDGKLKVSDGNLLPLNDAATFPDGVLENDNEGRIDPATLFSAGDIRTNENVALIAMHTLLVREHNRLADEIKSANPSFTDEEIYQRARKLVGAIFQHITYSEYIPLLLGQDALEAYAGYDPEVDPRESTLFAAAAFRLGHTQLASEIQRLGPDGTSLEGGSLSLQNAFFTPVPIQDDGIEPYLRGLAATLSQEVDAQVIEDVRSFLFGPPGSGGMDLASMNIQRGRDVGLPGYNRARVDFGLPPVTSFEEISSDPQTVAALASVYETVDDIDIWVGGISEDHAPGALIGPLLQRILADQFQRSRDGDRFYYENGQFSADELALIRATTLEQLVERNAPGVDLQSNAFLVSGLAPDAPAAAGTINSGVTEFRTIDGSENHPDDPNLGRTGSHTIRNFTESYADGISAPTGTDRANPRDISNAVVAQTGSIPNAAGTSSFLIFWGQILDHDLGLTPGGVGDTLKILGNLRPDPTGNEAYPFVAERMQLMLGHDVYPGVDNVVERPIYLPILDLANGKTIDPSAMTMVNTAAIPGAEVAVAPGTLLDRQGVLYDSTVSITEVPRELTPAVLPDGLIPDIVVTIQPADLVFSTPAPLSLPNRAEWPAGTMMDLWSINPITGLFDKVGLGQVSNDGTVVETVSGGIRNSSWHLFTVTDVTGRRDETKDPSCETRPLSVTTNSETELFTGTLTETHNLVGYSSLGESRGLTLTYDSNRAHPTTVLRTSYTVTTRVVSGAQSGPRSIARTISSVELTNGYGLTISAPENSWSAGSVTPADAGSRIGTAVHVDLSTTPSGIYDYRQSSGLARSTTDGNVTSATLTPMTGRIVSVNSVNSVFGSGWGLAGLLEISEARNGRALLINGDGSELIFEAPQLFGQTIIRYAAPEGTFLNLEKAQNGLFTLTTTDQTVYRFDSGKRLETMTDRNGNVTRYTYGTYGLTSIIDPVGLTTTFIYTGNQISAIVTPGSRTTLLEHDAAGNLTRVIDPDGATRTWGYNSQRLMISEINERGELEESEYDEFGRIVKATRRDGTTLQVRTVESQGLQFAGGASTTSPEIAREFNNSATFVSGDGTVMSYQMERGGHLIASQDSVGPLGTAERNEDDLVSRTTNGRGHETRYEYDERGNLVQVQDNIAIAVSNGSPVIIPTRFPNQSFPTGVNPNPILLSDMNGDGRPDVVTFNFYNTISVLSTNANGALAAPINYPSTGSTNIVGQGDINGDGRVDFVATSYTQDNIMVFLQQVDGSLLEVSGPTVAGNPHSMGLEDVNGDNLLDIVAGLRSGDAVAILLGDGTGNFSAPVQFPVGDQPESIAVRDLDNDGDLDIVTANLLSQNLTLLYGDGTGQFNTRIPLGLPRVLVSLDAAGQTVVLEDFNVDSIMDIAVSVRNPNNSRSDSVAVFLGTAAGSFDAPTFFNVGDDPFFLAVGELNGDNRPDLVATNYFGASVSLLLSTPTGLFSTPKTYLAGGSRAYGLTMGDLNGDNHTDVIVGSNNNSSVQVFYGDGRGNLSSAPTFATGSTPTDVVVGDVNSDGRPDILVANSGSNSIGIKLGNGFGGFNSIADLPSGTGAVSPRSLALADLNGDGNLDLVATNQSSANVSVYDGDGTGGFAAGRRFTVGSTPVWVTMGDVNGDGHLDLAVANSGDGSVSILVNDGNGGFDVATHTIPSFPRTVVLADVNGDTFLDVITANNDTASIFFDDIDVLLGNGQGGFGPPAEYGPGDQPYGLVITDYNADGSIDILVSNRDHSNVVAMERNPAGDFVVTAALASISSPDGMDGADLNGDGLLDLVVFSASSNSVAVLYQKPDHTFSDPVQHVVGGGVIAITISDVDNNGALDIVTANSSGNTVTVLLNNAEVAETTVATTSMTYDPIFSMPTSMTDELGRQTLMDIDPSNGNVIAIHRPENQNFSFTYTRRGQIDTSTDPLGRVTDYDYDLLGRVTTVTYAVGTTDAASVGYEYDGAGNVSAMIDEKNARTEYEYDARNRLILVRDALDQETRYTYDPAGNLIAVRDALNRLTTSTYDAQDRLISVTDALNQTSRFTYDQEGNVLTVTDPLEHVTRHRYDARNRRIETTDPDGGITSFRYDVDDNLIALTDPVGNRTLFDYDSRNRLVREIDPLGGIIKYTYDVADNLIQKTDRNGRITQYEYDARNRLKKETWVTGGNIISYAYDVVGNLTSIHDSFSALTYTYDSRDRVRSVDNNGTPQAPRMVLNYAYDAVGNVTSVVDTINGQAGATTSYSYDPLQRLERLTQSGAGLSDKRVDFTYNALDQYEHIRRYSDLAGTSLVIDTAYGYDSLNRISSLDHVNSAAEAVAFFHYQYDSASRITQITDVDGTTTYTYDDRDQLIGADHTDPSNVDETYTYDANGNRVESHLHANGYVTGPGNRLLSDGTYNYQYDAEGNTIRRTEISTGNIREFHWDHRNRLAAVIDKTATGVPTQEVEFTYDAFDRRIRKDVDTTPLDALDGFFEHYLYDHEDVLLDFTDADGAGATFAVLSQRYLHGNRIDQVFAQEDTSMKSDWLLTDRLGTTRGIVNNFGTIISHLVYDAYGNMISESPEAVETRFLYTGRELDAETGLQYSRYRYLDSIVGRFISEDKIRFSTGARSLYDYTSNQPITRLDPFGLESTTANIQSHKENTVLADGDGGFKPYIIPNQTPYPEIEQCIKEHELAHIEWLKNNWPELGYEDPEMRIPKRKDKQIIWERNKKGAEFKRATEEDAYRRQIACLNQAIHDNRVSAPGTLKRRLYEALRRELDFRNWELEKHLKAIRDM